MSSFQQWPGSAPSDRGKRDALRWPEHDADQTSGTCRERGETNGTVQVLAQVLHRSYARSPYKCMSPHFGSNQRLLQMIRWILSSCPCQSMTKLRYNARKMQPWGLPILFRLGRTTHPRRRRNHCIIGPHGEFDGYMAQLDVYPHNAGIL